MDAVPKSGNSKTTGGWLLFLALFCLTCLIYFYKGPDFSTTSPPYLKAKQNKAPNPITTVVQMDEFPTVENQVFFLETSGRGYLLPRQACSVESAARFSGLPVKVLIANRRLDLDASNATRQLYSNFGSDEIAFHYLDVDQLVQNTPLESLIKSQNSLNHASGYNQITILSDVLRIAFAYKYGGFYSDLDVVFLKDVAHFKNVLCADYYIRQKFEEVPNGDFHFEAYHPFLYQLMENSSTSFRENARTSLGPGFWYKVLHDYCKLDDTDLYAINNASCQVELLHPRNFYPVYWGNFKDLFLRKPDSPTWDEMFANSSMVHMYAFLSRDLPVTRDPQKEAYSYLGPTYCPLSYEGSKVF